MTTALAPKIHEWAERAANALAPAMVEPLPSAASASGKLLWWHRVAVNPNDEAAFPATHWYGVRAELAYGAAIAVGNGFTSLHNPGQQDDQRLLRDVLDGLMIATQEWLVVDEAKRLLADQLVKLSLTRGSGPVHIDDQYADVLRFTDSTTGTTVETP